MTTDRVTIGSLLYTKYIHIFWEMNIDINIQSAVRLLIIKKQEDEEGNRML